MLLALHISSAAERDTCLSTAAEIKQFLGWVLAPQLWEWGVKFSTPFLLRWELMLQSRCVSCPRACPAAHWCTMQAAAASVLTALLYWHQEISPRSCTNQRLLAQERVLTLLEHPDCSRVKSVAEITTVGGVLLYVQKTSWSTLSLLC